MHTNENPYKAEQIRLRHPLINHLSQDTMNDLMIPQLSIVLELYKADIMIVHYNFVL